MSASGKNKGRGRVPMFAGGDVVTGSATVIEAMGAGRRAAAAFHEYVMGRAAKAQHCGKKD